MKCIKWLDDNLEDFLMVLLLIGISVIMMLQVIMRYVFSSSMSWPEEACRYCWIVTTCLSIGYCTKKKCALRVEVLLDLLPGIGKKIVNLLIDCIGILSYGFLAVESVGVLKGVVESGQKSTAMQMPLWILYLALMVGFVLATIRAVEQMAEDLRQKKEGDSV